MPREKSFTESDVQKAIAMLKRTGKLVSNRNIREVMGSGSLSTIAKVRNNHPEWEDNEATTAPIGVKVKGLENQLALLTEQVAELMGIIKGDTKLVEKKAIYTWNPLTRRAEN